MAYATEIRTADRAYGVRDRLNTFLADRKVRREQNRTYRTTLRELEVLSDRELADLGLARSNLRSIAWDAAYGA